MSPWQWKRSEADAIAEDLRGRIEGHFIVDEGVKRRVRSVFITPSNMIGVTFRDNHRRYYNDTDIVRVIENRGE